MASSSFKTAFYDLNNPVLLLRRHFDITGQAHAPLKISMATSAGFPFGTASALLIQYVAFALSLTARVTKAFIRYRGCMCIGFQIGRPSAFIAAKASKISVGQVFPFSLR